MEAGIMIGITELRHDVDSKQPLEERLKIVMKKALNHWLVLDEESQFKMAVGAVLAEATEEEQERINIELRVLKALSAAISGVPIDWGNLVADEDRDKTIGLSGLWREVKAESN